MRAGTVMTSATFVSRDLPAASTERRSRSVRIPHPPFQGISNDETRSSAIRLAASPTLPSGGNEMAGRRISELTRTRPKSSCPAPRSRLAANRRIEAPMVESPEPEARAAEAPFGSIR